MTAPLVFVNVQAANADPLCRAMAEYLSRETPQAVVVRKSDPWQVRRSMLLEGEVDLGFLCGLPYIENVDGPAPSLEVLAAPIMGGSRWEGHPVYYSEVVVLADSPFQAFEDLCGASWAYNEPGSHSGHALTRAMLARKGETGGFFGRVVEAGAHQASIELLLNGEVAASAIDSMVLEMELRHRPELVTRLRVLETWGPSPAPAIVASLRLPVDVRHRVRTALTGMHASPAGRTLLADSGIARWAPVTDAAYDPIRAMKHEGAGVALKATPAQARR